MNLALKCRPMEHPVAATSVDSEIRAFLAGDTNGEPVLHALYDHVLDEPVPEHLLALLKG